MSSPITSSYITTTESVLGGAIRQMLDSDEIQVGSAPSYELAKAIYLYHPLGRKMAEGPVMLAQSQRRRITVGEAPPEVAKAFEKEWKRLRADRHIGNAARIARIYGISSLVLGVDGEDESKPLDPATIAGKGIWLSTLDPLNTAGSLVLSQIPTSPDFNKPVIVRSNGVNYHPSRFVVSMNEEPVYLAYTNAAFGFVGRSVYQRALFPLKSYLRSMIANDMVQSKLGLLIAKMVPPGPVVTKDMGLLAAFKALLVKRAQTGQVLTIGTTGEAIETLNMQNVDGAGTYSRTNIIKDIATAADMPAKLLDNETLVSGFGEGTEDAKGIALYIETMREWLTPLYEFMDSIVQRRAWDDNFIAYIKREYAEVYEGRSADDIFSEWRDAFSTEWPSFLIEPESEQVKVDDVRLQATVAVVQTLIEVVDPQSQLEVLRFLADNVSANKRLFPHALDFDWGTLEEYLVERAAQMQAQQQAGGSENPGAAENPENAEFKGMPREAKMFGSFEDSAGRLKRAIARLDAKAQRRAS